MGKKRTSGGQRPTAVEHFGLLNIAKPAGLTSRVAVDRIQRLVRPAKAGHAGTLDPLARGVLLVCLGKATRLVPLIQELRKTYRATFLLGWTSHTDDVERGIIETPGAFSLTREEVLVALPAFVGRIHQRPPIYSSVRIGGRRAYTLARRGEEVELESRPVDVYRIELLQYEFPELVLEIECGSGTYIRSIGRDLGERLGCGAVMSALERTAIGPFCVNSAVPVEAVTRESLPQFVLPPTAAVRHLPHVIVNAAGVATLANGRSVSIGEVDFQSARAAESPSIAAIDAAGVLVALAEIDGDRLVPKTVFASQA